MGRIFKASPEQQDAYAQSLAAAKEQQLRSSKDAFIHDFLEFSNRITEDTHGAVDSIGMHAIGKGLAIFQLEGKSKHTAAPTESEPNRGYELRVYRAVVGKADYWTKGKPMGGVAVAAQVESGFILGGTFPRLTGNEVIMQVNSLPPEIRYKDEGGELSPLSPEDERWSEVLELGALLMSREAELTY